VLSGSSNVVEAQKPDRESSTGCSERVIFFSENCQKINTANTQIWIFLKNFLSLAQSVLDLWPGITSPATQVARAAL